MTRPCLIDELFHSYKLYTQAKAYSQKLPKGRYRKLCEHLLRRICRYKTTTSIARAHYLCQDDECRCFITIIFRHYNELYAKHLVDRKVAIAKSAAQLIAAKEKYLSTLVISKSAVLDILDEKSDLFQAKRAYESALRSHTRQRHSRYIVPAKALNIKVLEDCFTEYMQLLTASSPETHI